MIKNSHPGTHSVTVEAPGVDVTVNPGSATVVELRDLPAGTYTLIGGLVGYEEFMKRSLDVSDGATGGRRAGRGVVRAQAGTSAGGIVSLGRDAAGWRPQGRCSTMAGGGESSGGAGVIGTSARVGGDSADGGSWLGD